MPNSLGPHGLYSPWNSLGQNTAMRSCSLLQGIFPTQGLNPGLPHCRWVLYKYFSGMQCKYRYLDIHKIYRNELQIIRPSSKNTSSQTSSKNTHLYYKKIQTILTQNHICYLETTVNTFHLTYSLFMCSVQLLSRVQLFANPWTTARQASLSITNSRSPPKPMFIESVIASIKILHLSVIYILEIRLSPT